jgi:hypothetical protein
MVAIAKDKGVVEGRKMRVDTTVVETKIHYPTDSSLLGDVAADWSTAHPTKCSVAELQQSMIFRMRPVVGLTKRP